MTRTQDSNLFSINHDAIVAVLRDANQRLIQRTKELVSALDRVPDTLNTSDEIKKAEIFMRQLNEAIQECKNARLNDGRPFNSATKTVKSFFDEIDKPLRAALDVIRNRLTDAALRTRSGVGPVARPLPIGNDIAGNDIISLRAPPAGGEAAGIGLALGWEVDGFDRRLLDLEALRPFLTDAALLAACNKHLVAQGPNQLRGVIYKEVLRR